MKKIAVIFLLYPLLVFAQEKAKVDFFAPFRYFVGDWTGHETGKAGIGKGERSYEFIMNDVFLYSKNISRFEPQEKNPKGEVHEDWGIYSFDRARQKIVLREFFIEAFIIQYTLDTLHADQKKFVFTSESVENAPPGMRARMTLEIKNQNEFEETFELALPGKEFSQWLKNYWTRKL